MKIEKPMPILLIEDNEEEVSCFKKYVATRNDVKILKDTNSSYNGIEYTKTYIPEGIILDLELHNGEGSGISFLENLQNLKLDFKPLIVVTTNISSNITYERIRELGVDFIFYKKQSDYSPEIVINSMVSLRKTLYSSKNNIKQVKTTTETQIEYEQRIKDRINNELDLIGISNHLKGRKYLFEAIFYLLNNSEKDCEPVFYYIAKQHNLVNSSVNRAMQTAINYAWKSSAIDDLQKHYTARINYHTGVPTPTEFVYFYEEKIRQSI